MQPGANFRIQKFQQKNYISHSRKIKTVDINVQQKGLKIWINMRKRQLGAPKQLAKDVSNTGHWGNGDYEINVTNTKDIEYIMSLIKQAL